jgi:16S rRNA (adenine1518-N6/adenine1519-N6)-dimethyltransferase
VAVNDPEKFARLVQAAFTSRRKVLRNTLKGWLRAEEMQALGIDPIRRAETLSLTEFAVLSNAATG